MATYLGDPSIHDTLIQAEELSAHLEDPRWRIIDCRFSLADGRLGRRHYEEGHIPGALYAHLDDDLASPVGPRTGRHPLPEAGDLAARLGCWGISGGSGEAPTRVVVYDDCGGAMAVRLWWMLRWLGHREAALLDGGWQAWLQAGLPVSREILRLAAEKFIPHPDNGLWCSVHELVGLLQRGECLLLDCRDRRRFRGEIEPIDPVAGHVPGASNLPYLDNLDADGRFLEPGALRTLYEPLVGGRDPARVVHMCGSGVTACHNLLAMEIAGMGGSRLYPGSWSEWISDPSRPVARS